MSETRGKLTIFDTGILLGYGRRCLMSSLGDKGIALDGRFTPLKWTSQSVQLRRPSGRAICLVPDLSPVDDWDEAEFGRPPTLWERAIIGDSLRLEDITGYMQEEITVARKTTPQTLRAATGQVLRLDRSDIYEDERVLFLKTPYGTDRSGTRMALAASFAENGHTLAHVASPDCVTGKVAALEFGKAHELIEDMFHGPES